MATRAGVAKQKGKPLLVTLGRCVGCKEFAEVPVEQWAGTYRPVCGFCGERLERGEWVPWAEPVAQPGLVVLTEQLVHAGRTGPGGWNKEQLRVLGVAWPPEHGWVARLVGKKIGGHEYERFLFLRGAAKVFTRKARKPR